MAKKKLQHHTLEYRPAKPTDGQIASRLLYPSFSKKATFLIGLGDEERAKAIIKNLFALEGHRLSYQFAEFAYLDGRVVGINIAYPARELGKLNRKLGQLLLKQYRLRGKFALIVRGLSSLFITEAAKDEFLLSNLSVKRQLRGQGIGGEIISHLEETSLAKGCSKVSIMVSVEEKKLRSFYEGCGYKVKAIYLESNKRVKYLGPGYLRMVKDLTG